jgi:hypothetical protein
MPWQPDRIKPKLVRPSRHRLVHDRERDWYACPPVQHLVNERVPLVIVVTPIPGEPGVIKHDFVKRLDCLKRPAASSATRPFFKFGNNCSCKIIKVLSNLSFVESWVVNFRNQDCPLLQKSRNLAITPT